MITKTNRGKLDYKDDIFNFFFNFALQFLRPSLVLQYVALVVFMLSCSAIGQQQSFGDYDYSDFANFQAVASPAAALPPRPVQRQRNPAPQQFQAAPRGQIPPRREEPRQSGSSGTRGQVGRGEAVPQDVRQREEPKPIKILKQINE